MELNVTLNPMLEDNNITKADKYIRNIKESGRCVQKTFPIKKIPGRLTRKIVSSYILWLDVYPSKSWVSNTMIPRTIIIGLMIE